MTGDHGAESLQLLLEAGWRYHDTESPRLARELEAAAAEEVPAGSVTPFLMLATHTIGEHLGDWARALRLGKRVLGSRTPTPETANAWGRLYVAASLAGDPIEAAALELSCLETAGDDFAATLLDMRFMLAAALVSAERIGEAARLFGSALALTGQVRQSPLLDRTIAIAGNNLGWALYEMSPHTADVDTLMQLCATTSAEFWQRCGTWINVERAHYLNALVANITRDPASGLAHADAALAIIAANGQRPLDGALLQLARAVSFAALGNTEGSARAFDEADAAASKLATADLQQQYAAERASAVRLRTNS